MIFPWQKEQWQYIWQVKQENRLPHALLLTGLSGVGKTTFANSFASALLCQRATSDGHFCHDLANSEHCHACHLIAGETHPNVLWIRPEKTGQAIKVDQIRNVSEFVYQSSLQGEYRIVIINPANYMNMNAANALLKTLEEPANGAIIILINEQNKKLPATILSRCQRIIFPRPKQETALLWLKEQLQSAGESVASKKIDPKLILNLASGAPLAAWQLIKDDVLSVRHDLFEILYNLSQHNNDPLKSAASLQHADVIPIFDFMLSWLMDLLRLQLGGEVTQIVNKDYDMQLMDLKQRLPVNKTSQLFEYIHRLHIQICSGINLNKQLLIEDVLIRWVRCM